MIKIKTEIETQTYNLIIRIIVITKIQIHLIKHKIFIKIQITLFTQIKLKKRLRV